MNDTVKTIGAYILGVVSGGSIAAVVLKKKYEKKYREQYNTLAQSLRESYVPAKDIPKEEPDMPSTEEIMNAVEDDSLRQELAKLTEKYRSPSEPVEPTRMPSDPYLIEPDQFGDEPDYEQISLTYYADGKLADSEDDLVENVPYILGSEWQERFDKYDEDCVYVRNDARRCDYEITRDYRKYMDILEDKPYLLYNVTDSVTAGIEEEE